MTEIRTDAARRGDHDQVAGTLGRAFQVDPIYEWLYPDPAGRRTWLPHLLGTLVGPLHAHRGPTDVARHGGWIVGAAVWERPGAVGADGWSVLRALPGMLRATGRRLPDLAELGSVLEARRPAEPHWYLFHLGAEPGWQGHGVGSALLRAGLARSDAEGRSAHLECKPAHVSYYSRFGFDVTDEVDVHGVLLKILDRPVER